MTRYSGLLGFIGALIGLMGAALDGMLDPVRPTRALALTPAVVRAGRHGRSTHPRQQEGAIG